MLTRSSFTHLLAILFLIMGTIPTASPAQRPASDPSNIGALDPGFAAMHQLRPETPRPLDGRDFSGEFHDPAIYGYAEPFALRGYLVEAARPRPGAPAIVLIHEWWGLNKHIRDTADVLAARGYTVLAVDLYHGAVATDGGHARQLMQRLDRQLSIARLKAAIFMLRSGNAQRPVGVMGWCLGGGYAVQLAMAERNLQACVVFYGQLPQEVAEVRRIQAPVLGIFAQHDRSITPAMVETFAAAAERSNVRLSLHMFDADHAFANPSGPRFNAAAAQQAWEVTYAFLDAMLRPTNP